MYIDNKHCMKRLVLTFYTRKKNKCYSDLLSLRHNVEF